MKRLIACLIVTSLTALPAHAAAPKQAAKLPAPEPVSLPMDRPMGIAAVVNNDIITSQDVEDRALLLMALTGTGADEKERAALIGRTLGMLIDEALQTQEAKRTGVGVTDKEVSDAISAMERSRGREPGSLLAFIRASHLSEASLRKQFAAQLAWHQTVLKKLRRTINPTDAEIARAQQTALAPRKRQQLQVAAIAVPIAAPGAEAEAKAAATARELADALADGKRFEQLAQEVMKRNDARLIPASWLDEEQLEPAVAGALRALAPGDTTQPLRSLNTYQIIRLLQRREVEPVNPKTELALKQMQIALPKEAPPKELDAIISIAKSVQQNPGSCTEKGIGGVSDFSGMDIRVNYLRTTAGAMSPQMRMLVLPLGVGDTTEPFSTRNGVELLMLCEKVELPLAAPDKEEVKNRLIGERAELEAEKMLRNLKRDAFIDIRSGK